MSNAPYSNRELDAKFDGVHEKLDAILVQATYTNGKVKKITLALVALAALSVGLGLDKLALIVKLIFALS